MSRRIILIESANEMGGVEFSTLYLASHLNSDFWKVKVVCPGEGKLTSACRNAGVQIEIVPMPRVVSTSFRIGKADTRLPNPFAWLWNGFAILAAARRLRRFLLIEKPDLVLTKGMYAHFCGGLATRQMRIRCIWHVQDLISERFGGFYSAFFGFLARWLADEIVVDGTPIARQLPADLQKRISVVFNGVDVHLFRPGLNRAVVRQELRIIPDALVVGHAARLTPWKGQHHLLEAFAKLASRYPQARLLLVGAPTFDNDLYEQKLRSRTKELGLSSQVIFAGFRADLPQVLSAIDVFAYPSVEKDTSPLALLSAMACGLPVVAFEIEGVREVLGEAGLLVPVRDKVGMAAALEKLLENATLRQQMGNRSREKVLACFSLEQYVADMEAVFLRVGI